MTEKELLREFTEKDFEKLDITDDTKIFLNPYGKGQKISRKLKDFLDYLVTRKCNSDFTKRLEDGVRAVIENEEWRLEYMTLRMRDRENMEKGIAVGREEGIQQEKMNIVLNMIKKAYPTKISVL